MFGYQQVLARERISIVITSQNIANVRRVVENHLEMTIIIHIHTAIAEEKDRLLSSKKVIEKAAKRNEQTTTVVKNHPLASEKSYQNPRLLSEKC